MRATSNAQSFCHWHCQVRWMPRSDARARSIPRSMTCGRSPRRWQTTMISCGTLLCKRTECLRRSRLILRLRISRRLLVLGFPDAALIWAGPVRPDDTAERRLVLAEATLDIGDAPTARDLVEGLAGPEAAQIRAQALLQLGDMAAAAETLSASGQTDEASQANLWNGELGRALPDNSGYLAKRCRPDKIWRTGP